MAYFHEEGDPDVYDGGDPSFNQIIDETFGADSTFAAARDLLAMSDPEAAKAAQQQLLDERKAGSEGNEQDWQETYNKLHQRFVNGAGLFETACASVADGSLEPANAEVRTLAVFTDHIEAAIRQAYDDPDKAFSIMEDSTQGLAGQWYTAWAARADLIRDQHLPPTWPYTGVLQSPPEV